MRARAARAGSATRTPAGEDRRLLVRAFERWHAALEEAPVGSSVPFGAADAVEPPRLTEGLQAGERVIVEGQLKARPGMPVKPMDKPVSAEPGQPGAAEEDGSAEEQE